MAPKKIYGLSPLSTRIYRLRERGLTERQIAIQVHRAKSTVHKILSRRQPSSYLQQLAIRGRPRATTLKQDRHLAVTSKLHWFASTRQLSSGIGMSRMTVWRRVMSKGLRFRVAVRNSLTTANIRARLTWIRLHIDTDFRNWIFSDQSRFELAD